MKLQLQSMVLILMLAGCGRQESAITNLSMLEGGKTFAVPTGTVADQFVTRRFPDARIVYYNSVLDCALAVQGGKADAGVYDQPILKNIAAKNPGLVVLDELLEGDNYGFAVRMDSTALKTAIDETLAELKSNGTYNDMMKRWFPAKGAPAPMPEIEYAGTGGILRFGTAAVTEPMSFMNADRKVVGFDIEFASYVARRLGRKLEITDMEFGAMLPALIAGKVDMIGAGLSITEERSKKVLFSQSYYPSGIAAIVRGEAPSAAKATSAKMKTAEDIRGRRIGVLLGSVHDSYAIKNYPTSEILQYVTVTDLLIGLTSNKVDVIFFDESSTPDILNKYPELAILEKDIFSVDIGAGFNKESTQLRGQFNSFLKEIKSNGVYDDMVKRWMDQGNEVMPEISGSKVNGTLNAGVVGELGMPFTIFKDGKLAGFDIELTTRFAASVGKEFVPVKLQFGSLIASISTKKIDIITASMMITEERQKQIDFSDPYYNSGVCLIARKADIETAPATTMAKLEDIADKKIGIFTGTVYDPFIAKKYPQAQVFRYDGTADLILSLKTGKIDAAMFDLITARLILKHNPGLKLLSDKVMTMPVGVGFRKDNPALRQEFNDFLREIRADGSYDKILKRWFTEDAEEAVMPEFPDNPTGKKVTAGVSVDDLPYVAIMNGKYVGLDIELIRTFAQRRNYNMEIITMEFPSLVAALASGKVDLVTDGIGITAERGKEIDFSDPYAEFSTAVLVAEQNLAGFTGTEAKPDKKPLLKRLSDSFHNNIILEKRYLLILSGLKLTILISIFAAFVGTLLGGLICWMRMSQNRILSAIAGIYINLLRGTPVLVLLMIIYYIVFASVNINPAIVAVFAFGLNFAAYVSEMFRTSIKSIDKGQKEAGIAGGFTKIQTFIHIITPQALRYLLPVYKGEFISLVKMTSIVGYIAVQDLTKASDIIRSRTFDAFFPLIMAAVLYLVLAGLLTWGLGYVEISVDPKRKQTKKVLEANQ